MTARPRSFSDRMALVDEPLRRGKVDPGSVVGQKVYLDDGTELGFITQVTMDSGGPTFPKLTVIVEGFLSSVNNIMTTPPPRDEPAVKQDEGEEYSIADFIEE